MIAIYDPRTRALGFYIDEEKEGLGKSVYSGDLLIKGVHDGVIRGACLSFPNDAVFGRLRTNPQFEPNSKPEDLTDVELVMPPWSQTKLDRDSLILGVSGNAIDTFVGLESNMDLVRKLAA